MTTEAMYDETVYQQDGYAEGTYVSDQAAPAGAATRTGRPVVSLGELQRAWEAIQAGRFRAAQPNGAADGRSTNVTAETTAHDSPVEWSPVETVIPILGVGGAVGATTLAVALATACPSPARVVECGSATRSGLAPASTAELGTSGDGAWRRGLRQGEHGPVLLERTARPISHAAAVPAPAGLAEDRLVDVTFMDCCWELDHLLAQGWLAGQVANAATVIVAATATVPGLRHLEVALDALADLGIEHVYAAVLGPRRKKWGRLLEGSLGPATRRLETAGGLVEIPLAKSLAVSGLTSQPLPAAVTAAAGQLLERLPQFTDSTVPADGTVGIHLGHQPDLEPLPGGLPVGQNQ